MTVLRRSARFVVFLLSRDDTVMIIIIIIIESSGVIHLERREKNL